LRRYRIGAVTCRKGTAPLRRRTASRQEENSLTGHRIGGSASAEEREGAHDPEEQDPDRGEQQGAAGEGLFHDRVVSWGQHGLEIPIGSDP
jgi:hypothetical protein